MPPFNLISAILSLLIVVTPIFAQDVDQEPIPLYEDLGTYSRDISTPSDMAQKYFNQGLQLAYAFGREAAVKSFREAQKYDPNCAMCYWGEALALGKYINGALLNPIMDSTKARAAYQAIEKAKSLSNYTNDNEKALIEALATRYKPSPKPEKRSILNRNYIEAMRKVVARFPNDLDAGTLLGEAIMVQNTWDYWKPDGQPKPGTQEAINVLESVLARNIKHPGACHHYIHIVEASPEPERAEACADCLADVITGGSHIQHMPSHIYMLIGRYGDAVRANQKAWLVDQKAAYDKGVAIGPPHNLNMLIFAARMDGQSAVALQAGRDLAKTSAYFAFYQYLVPVTFGRWEEVLNMTKKPENAFHEGFWHFSQGMAHLRTENVEKALKHLNYLSNISNNTPDSAIFMGQYPGNKQSDLLKIVTRTLEGEIAANKGHFEKAEENLRKAVTVQDNLPYTEPVPLTFSARHYLGAVLLQNNQPAKAEQVYKNDLKDHPENGWALKGLQLSLEAQGKEEEAAKIKESFEKAWARADVWLPSSRF